MPKKRTVYRDKKTGRYVSQSTWKRSRAQGGTRYVRQVRAASRKLPKPVLRPVASPVHEWIVTFQPSKSARRQFDVIVTAKDETEAYDHALGYLLENKSTQGAIQANRFGLTPHRGKRTKKKSGYAEFRSKS